MSWLQRWRRARKPRVFLSYRRHDESSGYAARLGDRLNGHFGADQVFRDIEGISPGDDFANVIREALASCAACVVVIGPDWSAQINTSGGLRLHDPNDWVQIEVSTALQSNIRIFPVLVAGARCPRPEELPATLQDLCRRQAHELTDQRWEFDVHKLLTSLEATGIEGAHSKSGLKDSRSLVAVASGGAAVLVLVCGIGAALVRSSTLDMLPAAEPPKSPAKEPAGIPKANSLPNSAPAATSDQRQPPVSSRAPVVSPPGRGEAQGSSTTARVEASGARRGSAPRCSDSERWTGAACVSLCAPGQRWMAQSCRPICDNDEIWNGERCASRCPPPSWQWCERDQRCEPKGYDHSARPPHMDLSTPAPAHRANSG